MSDRPAVLRAVYATWRPVPSRRVLQLVFELPIEQTRDAMDVLGTPSNETSLWCAIARLQDSGPDGVTPALDTPGPQSGEGQGRRYYNNLSHAMCNDKAFQAWLGVIPDLQGTKDGAEIAGKHVKATCKVQKRSHIDGNPDAEERLERMRTSFIHRNVAR